MSDKWEVKDGYSDGDSYKREEWNKLRDMVNLNEKLARVILEFLDRKGYSVTYPNPANNLSGVDIEGSIGLSNFDTLNSAGNSTNSAVKGTENTINSKLNSLDEKAQIGYRWVERQYSRGTETNLTASMINQMISREKENLSILEIIRFLEVVFGMSIDEINEQILSRVGMKAEVLENQSLTQSKRYFKDLDADLDGATLINYIYGEGKAVFHKDNGDGTYYLICVDLLNWKVDKKTLFNFNPIARQSVISRYSQVYWNGEYWWCYEHTADGDTGTDEFWCRTYWYKYDENGNEVDSGYYEWEYDSGDYDGSLIFQFQGKIISSGWSYILLYWEYNTNAGKEEGGIRIGKIKENSFSLVKYYNLYDPSLNGWLHLEATNNKVLGYVAFDEGEDERTGGCLVYGYEGGNLTTSSDAIQDTTRTTRILGSYGADCILAKNYKYTPFGYSYICAIDKEPSPDEVTVKLWSITPTGKFSLRETTVYSNSISCQMKVEGLCPILEWHDADTLYFSLITGENRTSYTKNDFSGTKIPYPCLINGNLVIKVESDGIIRSDEYEWTPDEDFEGVVIIADNDATSLSWGYPSSDGKIREYKQGVSTKINNCGHQTTVRIYKVKFI